MDESAVTPAIGVVLMVAITMVLAGAAMFLLTATASDSAPSPLIVMVRDENDDRWMITTGATEPQDQYAIYGPQGVRHAWNATATSASPPLPTSPTALSGTAPWDAGAYLSLCGDGAAVEDVTVAFVDLANNRIITETTFGEVAACA